MKQNTFSLLFALFSIFTVFSQTTIQQIFPQGITYQAVARDTNGEVLANQNVTLKIHLGESNVGDYAFSETHSISTNDFGLFSLFIGKGTLSGGNFYDVPWSSGNVWIDIEIQNEQGAFETISSSKLWAVPYALHALSASEISSIPGEVDANWSTTGNADTNANDNFIGTTDETELVFKTNDTERLKLSYEGVTIISDLEGSDSNYNAHPLKVEGGNQGIAIKINNYKPNRDQNFITFFGTDENGDPVSRGRIEGSKPDITAIKQILYAITHDGVSVEIEGEGIFDFGIDSDVTNLRNKYFSNDYTQELLESSIDLMKDFRRTKFSVALSIVSLGVEEDPLDAYYNLIDFFFSAIRYGKLLYSGGGAGVAFESGGADYAEWLKKANPDEKISFGEVVGIKNGLISKTFIEADQFMAITSNPIIVGGMPERGSEAGFKKVALMGQVPIVVFGKVSMGDYILPSGNGDGYGKALHPKDMKANDYSKIIGVAWSSSSDNDIYSYINTAVGFNANQMGMALNNMQEVINSMQRELVKLNPEFRPVYFETTNANLDNTVISNEEFIEMMMDYCPDCSAFGRETFKCYIKCWINTATGSDLNRIDRSGNAIRAIVKKTKPGVQMLGKNVSVVIEILKDFMADNVIPTMDNLQDALFASDGIINLDSLSNDVPDEVKNLLISIRDRTLTDNFSLNDFPTESEKINKRIMILKSLAGEN